MGYENSLDHVETLLRQARSYENIVKWIEKNIGIGLSFGENVEDKSGKIIFTTKDTPAKSPQRLLACLLMTILMGNQENDNQEGF